jgi:HK97 family phage portal protein
MVISFERKKSHKQKRTSVFFGNDNVNDMLCPKGSTSIAHNEEVTKCANIVANLVSSMTIKIMQEGDNGATRIKNELSKKLDIYPNKDMTRKNFIFKIARDLMILGNSVVIPVYNGSILDNLKLVDMSGVSFNPSGDSYVINVNGTIYQPDEVLHFVHIPKRDYPYEGEAYKDAILQEIKNLAQANATKTGFLKSKWKPSMIISIMADSEDLQDPEKRKKILGSYADASEEGEPWVIPAGELDIKTVQPLTLNDLAIPDSIRLDKLVIAATMSIPGFMVGIGDFKVDQYNNMISTIIMTIGQIIQQEFSKKLIISPNWYVELSPKSLLQYNLTDKSAFVKDMVSGGMLNRNEGRTEFGYSPVDNPGMDEYVVLENYIPVAKVGDQNKLKGGG